jgi:integrase
MATATTRVTGHAFLRDGKRGPVYYLKYRLADGRQLKRRLGPAWTERSRPPAGYYTHRTARDALQELLADARRGTLADSQPRSGRSFGDAVAEWLRYVEHDRQRAASTLADYRNVSNSMLAELGRDTPVETITRERIEKWRERLLDEGELSRRTIQKTLVLLFGVLKRAKRRGWIQSNPAEDVERVTVKRSGDFNVLSPVEVAAAARATVNDQDAAIVTVAAFTGLRLGELRALRWRDVDFAKSTVHVRGNFTHGQKGTPKSGKVRSVPLIDQASVALDRLSTREHFTDAEDLVFCSETGDYLNDAPIRKAFYDALTAAGLGDKREGDDPIVFHDLRHTFGTLAVEAWPLHDVQAYMGHADIQTTMIYVHHQPKTAAADALTRIVAAASGTAEVGPEIGPEVPASTATERH